VPGLLKALGLATEVATGSGFSGVGVAGNAVYFGNSIMQ
jgi:hypothetical protein